MFRIMDWAQLYGKIFNFVLQITTKASALAETNLSANFSYNSQ